MLSIGLGQEQQFTLILQTLQQLRDVYGDSVDKIVQGNTSNIVFLKSTDDSMLDTLQKMSGVTHKTFIDGKSVQVDHGQVFMEVSNNVTYNASTKEVPVISYNDMAFISERNSIVFRAGDSPVWNRNETILPMSWRLFKNTIVHPGHEYSLQTIPTLSSALDFDVRKNQPNFQEMLEKRKKQAIFAERAQELYKQIYGLDDSAIARLDPDDYADDIMQIINLMVKEYDEKQKAKAGTKAGQVMAAMNAPKVSENTEVLQETKKAMEQQDAMQAKIYAGGQIAKEDLISVSGQINRSLESEIIQAFINERGAFEHDTKNFRYERGSLYGINGTLFIERIPSTKDYHKLDEASKDPNSNVYAEGQSTENDMRVNNSYRVHDAFYRFLASGSCSKGWKFASGKFETQMANLMSAKE